MSPRRQHGTTQIWAASDVFCFSHPPANPSSLAVAPFLTRHCYALLAIVSILDY